VKTAPSFTASALTSDGSFIREWLLCGPFPNPPHAGDEVFQHEAPCVGFDTDYLTEHGGEKKIVPTAGMTHTKKDGASVKWIKRVGSEDAIDLCKEIIKDNNVVAYAFTTVDTAKSGPYLLCLGSDDGVLAWVNGKEVHRNLIARGAHPDQDLVPIRLKKGSNRILLKIEQGDWGWGFMARVVPGKQVFSETRNDTNLLKVKASLTATPDRKGRTVTIVAADALLASGVFGLDEDRNLATTSLDIPFPALGESEKWDIVVDDEVCGSLDTAIPRSRADAFRWQTPRGYPSCVFEGETLPVLDFERPLWIKHLIGPYSLSATYYDADYNEVETAEKVGRYGAVLTIKTKTMTTKRFVTLFRQAEPVEWWNYALDGTVTLPEQLGVSPAIVEKYSEYVNRFVGGQIGDGMRRHSGGAELLAALLEAEADGKEATYYNSPSLRNRAWWLPLKRKLFGMDKKYKKPFKCPEIQRRSPARVVHAGTLKDAGMKADFPSKLDKHLTAWADDSDEAFAVIVVRHGVIAFHKAYGTRDGEPMTLETKSWMASTTKMLSGSLMVMLLDQGMLKLTDRADKYLPPLKKPPKEFPATIRHLYTHTAGMQGHWGSWFSDMEYRVMEMTPFYEVGAKYQYDGAGLDLCGKILELITGETLPTFFKNHLLDPLGCENTDVDNACGSATSTPLDMARIGQMLLQKGAYGTMRFFSEASFKNMLPQELPLLTNPGTYEYGLGTQWYTNDGLGKGTFAHGAASSAITRIDPENDLVIIMTRNSAGQNFGKYRKDFFKLIVDGIEKEE
jgi:CubicO group peptidase (beta-lactamase class C family)